MKTIAPDTTRDPAPSRMSYRMQRLWLTPFFRKTLRVGLPVICVVGAVGGFLTSEIRRDTIYEMYHEARRSIEQRPEFMVNMMAIDGASALLSAEIRGHVLIDFPASSFDLDLEALRQQLEALDPVARVTVRIRTGGVLQVDVTERLPRLVWRSPDGLMTLDGEGHKVRDLGTRSVQAHLPLIAGGGADTAAAQALALFAAAEPVSDRLRGLHRRGDRRWDVVLDRDQVIQLPEQNPVPVLESLMALDKAQDLMSRHVTHIDLRNGRRPTVRLAPEALEELRHIRSIEAGDASR